MNTIRYPLGESIPRPGETIELAPGMRWLRMPLPSSLGHVNLWLLEDGAAWTIVDCGIGSDRLKELWEQVFASNLGGRPVRRVIATHMHSDHLGLAHWLCERFGAELWISQPEYCRACELIAATAEAFGATAMEHLAAHGVADRSLLEWVRRHPTPYPALVPALPPTYRALTDRAPIKIGGRSWRCIAGYGHSPEHIALYCDELSTLIAGDMLLPRISTYVGVGAIDPDASPLTRFLDSIDRFLDLPAGTLVLPSHGQPFVGIRQRVAELRAHHAGRLERVGSAVVGEPRTAADLVPILFPRPLDPRNYVLALGETIAHLRALAETGALRCHVAAGGMVQFSR